MTPTRLKPPNCIYKILIKVLKTRGGNMKVFPPQSHSNCNFSMIKFYNLNSAQMYEKIYNFKTNHSKNFM